MCTADKQGSSVYENRKAMLYKCLEENSLTVEDVIANSNNLLDETPENIACFHKCILLQKRVIYADGAIRRKKLFEEVQTFNISDDARQEFESCINEVGSVKDCKDSGKFLQCFWKLLHH